MAFLIAQKSSTNPRLVGQSCLHKPRGLAETHTFPRSFGKPIYASYGFRTMPQRAWSNTQELFHLTGICLFVSYWKIRLVLQQKPAVVDQYEACNRGVSERVAF